MYLFDQLKNKGEINLENDTPTVMLVLPLTEERKLCLELADTLRENFIPTEVAPVGNMKKALNYANKLNIPYVIFIGEDEIKEKVYTVKNMETGEQNKVPQENILDIFKQTS